jgi:hypothetical protein
MQIDDDAAREADKQVLDTEAAALRWVPESLSEGLARVRRLTHLFRKLSSPSQRSRCINIAFIALIELRPCDPAEVQQVERMTRELIALNGGQPLMPPPSGGTPPTPATAHAAVFPDEVFRAPSGGTPPTPATAGTRRVFRSPKRVN